MSKKLKKELIRIIIALIAFVILFVIDKVLVLSTIIDSSYSWLLPFFLYLVIYIFIGYDVLKEAFLNIIHGQMLDENFLMCFATLAAFALAITKGVRGEEVEGFDEACAVLLFYQVGEWFQQYAVGKSRKSISSLMDIRPDYANLLKDGSIEKVSPDEVKIGDTIVCFPGEKIPLDGIILSGNTELDTKALTGESMPKVSNEGDEVLSGTVNLTQTINISVTKEFYDSTVAKILDLVESAAEKKSKAENMITKFARFYTPIVVILAVLVAVLPPIFIGIFQSNWNEWTTWIYRALNFLVVSCPCALVISVPLSFVAGIGASSRYGILVKGANYLEKYNDANIFVFDKTGTLTKGNFKVTKVYPENKKDQILSLAASAEKDSSHPIALSIKDEYKGNILEGYTLTNIAGKGIKAIKDNDVILCGNDTLMDEFNIKYEKTSDIGTKIYVANNDEFIGYIVINDEIKEESYKAIKDLNNIGAKTVMLTGDNFDIAKNVAEKIGVTEFKSGLLPQDKVEEVSKMLDSKDKKDVLCFVGDGINDAPVLVRSDIGIAMGAVGSDAAIEAADIVLMNDDLNKLSLAKKIAKKTMRIVFENIWFALLVKVIILTLSALGITNMWIAIFGDVGVCILAILNASRANSKYKESQE